MVQRGLETVSSIARQTVVAGGPLSSLPLARSVTNRFEVLSVPGARRLARARHEPAVRLSGSVASAASRLPTRALHRALHAQARSVDVVVTSFPGLRGPRTVCGARVEESYPFGPRLGCLMNVTGFGIGDRLDVGVTLDPSAITEPELLVECLVSAFSAFAPTGTPPTGTRQRSAKS
jgi:hypothetical protein